MSNYKPHLDYTSTKTEPKTHQLTDCSARARKRIYIRCTLHPTQKCRFKKKRKQITERIKTKCKKLTNQLLIVFIGMIKRITVFKMV